MSRRLPRECSIDGCTEPVIARGWCSRHYQKWKRYGYAERPTISDISSEDRFWSQIDPQGDVSEYAPHLGQCWLWRGHTMSNGYGNTTVYGVGWLPHRYTYSQCVGPIPEGLQIDHLCRVRACCRPSHLEAVTPRENNRRGDSLSSRRARQTHCQRGHPLVEGNIMGQKQGRRRCRTCYAIWYAARKSQQLERAA